MTKEDGNLDTRQKILEVAERQFAAKGYSGAHLQSIAKEVGVQKTALYYYFPSKEALYAAVLERMLETLDRVVGLATSRGEPSVETLELLLDDLNDILAENPNYSQILIRIFVDRIEIDSRQDRAHRRTSDQPRAALLRRRRGEGGVPKALFAARLPDRAGSGDLPLRRGRHQQRHPGNRRHLLARRSRVAAPEIAGSQGPASLGSGIAADGIRTPRLGQGG